MLCQKRITASMVCPYMASTEGWMLFSRATSDSDSVGSKVARFSPHSCMPATTYNSRSPLTQSPSTQSRMVSSSFVLASSHSCVFTAVWIRSEMGLAL